MRVSATQDADLRPCLLVGAAVPASRAYSRNYVFVAVFRFCHANRDGAISRRANPAHNCQCRKEQVLVGFRVLHRGSRHFNFRRNDARRAASFPCRLMPRIRPFAYLAAMTVTPQADSRGRVCDPCRPCNPRLSEPPGRMSSRAAPSLPAAPSRDWRAACVPSATGHRRTSA